MVTQDLLPIHHLLQEIHWHGIVQITFQAHFNITRTKTLAPTMIFEYNASCIVLANSEGTKPRTKHIAIEWHHFHDQIKNGHIKLVKADTNFNWKPFHALRASLAWADRTTKGFDVISLFFENGFHHHELATRECHVNTRNILIGALVNPGKQFLNAQEPFNF